MSTSLRKSRISKRNRRDALRVMAGGIMGCAVDTLNRAFAAGPAQPPLTITGLKITPIALPDPPLLAASGCHGPYFLRNVVELRTEAGIVGIGETHGGESVTTALGRAQKVVIGQNAFAYRGFARELQTLGMSCYAGIELACLDACGRATGRRAVRAGRRSGARSGRVRGVSFLPVRRRSSRDIERSPCWLTARGRGDHALDSWGEVRTPEAMATMAARFRERWGFRVFKLKGGVLAPELEAETLKAMAERLGPAALLRIDPNGRWKTATAITDRQRDQTFADGIL